MKHIFYILFVLLSLSSLSFAQKSYDYSIEGFITDSLYNGKFIYLVLKNPRSETEEDKLHSVDKIKDSVRIENCQFNFKGTSQDEGELFGVEIPGTLISAWVTGEPGLIRVSFHTQDKQVHSYVNGTPINDEMTENLLKPSYMIASKVDSLSKLANGNMGDLMKENIVPLAEEVNEKTVHFIKNHLHYPIGIEFFRIMAWALREEVRNEILSQLPEKARIRVENYISEMQEIMSGSLLSAGQLMIDFERKSMTGETVRLSEITKSHKLILLDFWASWCGPCIRAIPDLIRIYQTYKDYGLEIIGISLDSGETEWKKAIDFHKMDWIQLLDSGESDSMLSTQYGIKSIPHTFLIDSLGTIVGTNLRGKELESEIKRILGIESNE